MSASTRNKKYHLKLREAVFAILGDTCKKCGFSDKRALQIDHIRGGGGKERQKYRTVCFYLHLLRQSDIQRKKKYQILCANCNWIKRSEKSEVHP